MRSVALRAALAAIGVGTWAVMAGPAAAAEDELTEVLITGSRVIANGNDAPTPVTVVSPDQVLATKPTTLFENLVDLPAFSGSRGVSNGPVNNGPTGAGNVSSLNLRNMGSQRNLVLFDGHRVPPASADGNVDVNALPQMLIQRVDVVTGGVSAVYGSDAITGVTNFVTDTKFDGVKIDLQRGISGESDDASYEVGLAFGHSLFAGRGHFEASFQRHNDAGLSTDQRDWTKSRWSLQGNGTTVPLHLQDYVAQATASYGGAITCPNASTLLSDCATRPLAGQSFNQNGILSPFNPGLRGAANGLSNTALQIGGDGVYFTNVNLKSRTRMDQGFARLDYDMTDTLHAYVAGSWNANFVTGNAGVQRIFPPGYNLGACNAFLPAQYQTTLGCTAGNSGTATEPTFVFNKAYDPALNFGFGQNNLLYTHNYFGLGNLAGRIGERYHWDATYTHSQSVVNVRALNQNLNNIYAAIDAVINPANGQAVCRVTLTNSALFPGCVPVNLFGPTSMSRDALNYMFRTIENTTMNTLDGLAGSLTGAPLHGWAGPIDMALSGEFRKQTLDLTTNSLSTDLLDCVGLRFNNCNPVATATRAQTVRQVNSWLPVSGVNQQIAEGAYEFNMPLIKDRSVFRDVNLNGAARYTRYSNDPNDPAIVSRSFNATTWKAGIVWDLPGGLTLRWARSRDIRAPSLYDLYQPYTIGSPTFTQDYIAGGNGRQVSAVPISGGNPSLEPEVAHTTTVGIVYRPAPQFSVSLDAYRITLVNALYALGGNSQPIQQACYNSGGTSPLCQLQERPNGCCTDTSIANSMTRFYTRNLNIAQQRTAGIDLEVNYSAQLLARALSLRTLLTYQPHITYVIPFAAVLYDSAGVAYPTVGSGQPAPIWKGALFARYKLSDRWAVDVSERYRSRLHWTADPSQTQAGGVSSMLYTNLSVSYDLPTKAQQFNAFLNVQNLFDRSPPPAGQPGNAFPGSYPNGFVVGDDIVGRYFVAGVRVRL